MAKHLPSDRSADRLTHRLRGMIENGLLKSGERVPSIRAGAIEYGVSRNTLIAAYEALVALGYLRSKQGAGFFVCEDLPRPELRSPVHIAEAIDRIWLLREQLEQRYAVRVGDGRPPQAWMEGSELGRHLRPMDLRKRPIGEGYSSPYGYLPLRERIAVLLAERSIRATADNVLLTEGANHALDLVIRHLTQPGDTVLVDAPGYYPLLAKLRMAMVEAIGVPRRPDGPDLEEIARLTQTHKARVFFTQSLAQNPTGNSISIGNAHHLLQLAAKFDMRIVDDDPFSDLFASSATRLAALDQFKRVVNIGTFAKTLSASLRVGYIAASAQDVDALTNQKMLMMVNSSGYVERIVHDIILSGQYRRHLGRLRARIKEAIDRTMDSLSQMDLTPFGQPEGGYYMWVPLPPDFDELEFARVASKSSIFIAPGSMFFPDKTSCTPAMRINIAFADDDRFINFYKEFRLR